MTTAAGDVVIRVGETGGEVATILLHGAAGSWTTWTPLLRAASRSGQPLTGVVAIDLPGWGESASPLAFSIALMSDAVIDIARSLGYRRWIVVGHSLGGFLALDIAARSPDAAEAVVLVSPSGAAVLDAIRRPLRGGLALPWLAGMLLTMRVLARVEPGARRVVRMLDRVGALRGLSAPLFAAPAHTDPSVISALAHEIRPRAFARAAAAAARYDETLWREITCPVRALTGAHDVFVAGSDDTAFRALLRDYDSVTVPGAGHFAAIEQPEAVLHSLREVADVRAGVPRG